MFGLKIFNAAAQRDSVGVVPSAPAAGDNPLARSIAAALRSGTGFSDAINGSAIDGRRAAGFAAAYRAIAVISGSLALLKPYIEDAEGYAVDDISMISDPADRAAAEVLMGDEPISGIFNGLPELVKQGGADLAVTGNFYLSKKSSGNGVLTGFEYHPPRGAKVSIHRGANSNLFLSYELPELGSRNINTKLVAAGRDVVHAKLPRLAAVSNGGGISGTAPLAACSQPLGIKSFAHDFMIDYFLSGGFGNQAIISLAGKVDAAQALEIEQRLHRKVDLVGERRRVYNVIGGGSGAQSAPATATVTALNTDTQSAEMVRQSAAAEEEVARAFGIPGSLIGIKEITRTQAGLEELTKVFIRFCLAHYRQAIESAITRSVFSGRGGYKLKFDSSKFTTGDLKTVAEFIMSTQGDAQRAGVLSFAEIRSLLDDIPKSRSQATPPTPIPTATATPAPAPETD